MFIAVFVCLLLIWSRRYLMKWVATLTLHYFNNIWPIYLNFSNMTKSLPNYLIHEKFKIFETRAVKQQNIFVFVKSHYFVTGVPIFLNDDMFWDTFLGFLVNAILQLFPRYIAKLLLFWTSKVGQNSSVLKKIYRLFWIFPFRCNLQKSFLEYPWLTLWSFVVFKILDAFPCKTVVSKSKQNFEICATWFDVYVACFFRM